VTELRRVVTTTDESGQSVVQRDGAPAVTMGDSDQSLRLAVLWEAMTPVSHDAMGGDPTEGFTPLPQPGAARFVRLALPGHSSADDADLLDVPMHRTDTLDLLYVVSGDVDLVLDSGRVRLATGDSLVMQGDVHGWRSASPAGCVLIAVMLGAPART
jgi:hypothetical protein